MGPCIGLWVSVDIDPTYCPPVKIHRPGHSFKHEECQAYMKFHIFAWRIANIFDTSLLVGQTLCKGIQGISIPIPIVIYKYPSSNMIDITINEFKISLSLNGRTRPYILSFIEMGRTNSYKIMP